MRGLLRKLQLLEAETPREKMVLPQIQHPPGLIKQSVKIGTEQIQDTLFRAANST